MKNSKKISRTRHQRGYTFENNIVKKFNNLSGYSAKRLGSPSTALPDVMVIRNMYKTMIAVEAKSTVGNTVYVPLDQIERCRDWVNQFAVYDTKIVMLAFKFGQTPERKLTCFYKIFPHKTIEPCEVKGDQYGETFRKMGEEWIPFVMENFKELQEDPKKC